MNFLQLEKDKQIRIINAGFKNFSSKGYKKASAMDIATEAGISKAMIFHYFGKKKDMYLYFIKHATDILYTYFDAYVDESVTDIFDIISLSTKAKLEACRTYPFIISFITNVFREEDKDIQDELDQYKEESKQRSLKMVDRHLDYSRFKEDIDKETALKIITLTSEGILSRFNSTTEVNASDQLKEYEECMLALKSILYKK